MVVALTRGEPEGGGCLMGITFQLMQGVNSLEKILMLGKAEDRRRMRGRG